MSVCALRWSWWFRGCDVSVRLCHQVELVVQRLPHAMVVAMKREHDGQPLGLVRDGGTGELLQVRHSAVSLNSIANTSRAVPKGFGSPAHRFQCRPGAALEALARESHTFAI